MVVWIIGLSGAGKTTLAREVISLVREKRPNVVLLDGDSMREAFGNDLGHSVDDRRRNADRICRIGRLLEEQGIDVVCAILSMFPDSREWNRKNCREYFEVFIDASVESLIERDSKGIYGRFIRGEAREVAGMDLEFPRPDRADLVIRNAGSRDELLKHAKPIADRILGGRA